MQIVKPKPEADPEFPQFLATVCVGPEPVAEHALGICVNPVAQQKARTRGESSWGFDFEEHLQRTQVPYTKVDFLYTKPEEGDWALDSYEEFIEVERLFVLESSGILEFSRPEQLLVDNFVVGLPRDPSLLSIQKFGFDRNFLLAGATYSG